MLKAVILDYQSFAPGDLNLQKLWGLPIDWAVHDYTLASETASRIADQQIILTNKVVVDETLLRNNPQLKLIIIMATGTNNVDLRAAAELEIPVCHIVDYSTESVAQHTFACMLALQSRIIEYDKAVKEGKWCNSRFFGMLDYPVSEIAGKTLGIIGYGAIGQRVEQVAKAFGMNILVAESLHKNNTDGRVSLSELYSQSDIISVHCPLSSYSENLIDAEAFAQMKVDTILLNMARGGIVDEKALAQALKSGLIRAAATDVLTQEPPMDSHILLDDTIPNLIITPHSAWSSREARQEMLDQAVNILQDFMRGKLINQVTL